MHCLGPLGADSAAMIAARFARPRVLSCLVEHPAIKPNLQNARGVSSQSFVVRICRCRFTTPLRRSRIGVAGETALMIAAKYNAECFKLLLQKDSQDGQTTIFSDYLLQVTIVSDWLCVSCGRISAASLCAAPTAVRSAAVLLSPPHGAVLL